jgi:DNA segregation ATPase FtsK/SpoIIIE-like protein
MGVRIDSSNPVRDFWLTPVVGIGGRITGWRGKMITGRWYTIHLAATPDMSTGTPRLRCRIQRDATGQMMLTPTVPVPRQLTLEDIDPELYTRARTLVADKNIISIQMIQRRLVIPYRTADNIIDRLEADRFIAPVHDGEKYHEVLKAG